MIKGSLVKWIGFPGSTMKEPKKIGIIIATRRFLKSYDVDGDYELRYDVAWGDGSIGSNLYEQTIEVIN